MVNAALGDTSQNDGKDGGKTQPLLSGHLHHWPAADVASHVRANLRALVGKE